MGTISKSCYMSWKVIIYNLSTLQTAKRILTARLLLRCFCVLPIHWLPLLSLSHWFLWNPGFRADKLYLQSHQRMLHSDITFHAKLPSKIKPAILISQFLLVSDCHLSFVDLLYKDFDPRCPPSKICCLNPLYIIHICLYTLFDFFKKVYFLLLDTKLPKNRIHLFPYTYHYTWYLAMLNKHGLNE